MALLTPVGVLSQDRLLRVHQAGAEGNVACGLAHLGRPARWLSRVGDDEFAPIITEFLTARGVDVSHVVTDPDRPTGLIVKTVRGGRTRVRYARTGSAASALSLADLTSAALAGVTVCHLSGVTPALSDAAAGLVDQVLLERVLGADVMTSFDVNHRPVLWPDGRAPDRLRQLANAADVVYVGLDEAEVLWGCRTPEAVRAVLPAPTRVVVKDGGVAGHEISADAGIVTVPALRADVVEVVGAGDAFAAGHLAGLLAGEDPVRRLRLGHAMAACTLQSPLDLPPLPAAAELRRWARLDDAGWRALHVTPAVLVQDPVTGEEV